MKTRRTIFLISLFFLIFPIGSQCQWKWVHPQPCGNPVTSMQAIDSLHVWQSMVGGSILYTSNGGKKWEIYQCDSNEAIQSVSFIDTLRGWATAENGGIYHTIDGGRNWSRSTSKDKFLGDVCFTDSLNGWIGRIFNDYIYHTTDGAITWDTVYPGLSGIRMITFSDKLNGWCGNGGAGLSHTTDGGLTWNLQLAGLGDWLITLCFPDSFTGYAFSSFNSKVYFTSDSGTTWDTCNSPGFTQTNCWFSDKHNGWVTGMVLLPAPTYEEGRIARTEDGGQSFHDIFTFPGPSVINKVTASDSLHAWATGYGGLIFGTRDGGQNWEQQALTLCGMNTINGVSVVKPQHIVFAVGNSGCILKSRDDGASWEKETSGTVENLTSVHFFNADHGIAIGENSQVIETKDGGIHWTNVFTGIHNNFYSLFFQSPSHGYFTCDNGIVGINAESSAWNTNYLYFSPSIKFSSVVFSDSLHGWAVGNGENTQAFYSQMIRTSDGGKTWVSQNFSAPFLHSISFSDSLHGWMCGQNGHILRTKDGGTTWDEFITGIQFVDLNMIQFTDSLHGWIVGEADPGLFTGGIALYTDDGGDTWVRRDAGIGQIVRSVFFTDPEFGFVTGDEGSILRWGENTVGISNKSPLILKPELRNYPNPFSNYTTFEYNLPFFTQVSLSLFNTIGTKIADLFNTYEPAGIHHIGLNTEFLSSGIYICRLQAGNYICTTKIVKW